MTSRIRRMAAMLLTVLMMSLSAFAEEAAPSANPSLENAASGQENEAGESEAQEGTLQLPLVNTQEPQGEASAAPTSAPTSAPTQAPAPTRVPDPSVRFIRDFSAQYAEKGDEITLSYTVRNDSALPIRNIVVEDGLIGRVGTISRLEAGERRTVSARIAVQKNCSSTPVLSYEYNGKTYTKRLAAGEIQLANVKMRVELEADKTNVAPGELVTLRLRVINEGDVNLYGLRAVEPMLGEMGSIVSVLPPGDECVVTRTVPMKSRATFRFGVSGSSDTGAQFEVQSNEMSVLVTPVAAQVRLTLRVQADRTYLSAPGEVCFSLCLDNECSLELRDVLLSEQTMGEIRNLAFVPTGEMPPIAQTYQVSRSGIYCFMAQVTDSVGDRMTVYSEPIEIIVSAEGEIESEKTDDPQQTQTAEPHIPLLDGASYHMRDDTATFEKLMIGTVLLMLATLMIWYAAARIRKEKKRRRRRRKKKKKNRRARAKKAREKRCSTQDLT